MGEGEWREKNEQPFMLQSTPMLAGRCWKRFLAALAALASLAALAAAFGMVACDGKKKTGV